MKGDSRRAKPVALRIAQSPMEGFEYGLVSGRSRGFQTNRFALIPPLRRQNAASVGMTNEDWRRPRSMVSQIAALIPPLRRQKCGFGRDDKTRTDEGRRSM